MRSTLASALAAVTAIALVIGAPSCGSDSSSTDDGGGASSSGDGGGFGGDSGLLGDGSYSAGDGAPGSCTPLVLADGTSPQCSNCKDDDGDGLVDWLDPECAGPLDNDEATFGTGIPGDNQDACKQDCFFDGNSGQGDDRCEWNLKCDPAITTGACTYDPGFKNCPKTQSDDCKKFCAKLTPNGCDCFGCCAVPRPDGGVANVRLVATCSLAAINDPVKCPPCTPNADCNNPCDRCELCVGKTSIPADCATSSSSSGSTPGGQTCSIGQACDAQIACPSGQYCVTGCCVVVLR